MFSIISLFLIWESTVKKNSAAYIALKINGLYNILASTYSYNKVVNIIQTYSLVVNSQYNDYMILSGSTKKQVYYLTSL